MKGDRDIKLLIFGNYNAFNLSLISRLHKEDHQIFVVTGQNKKYIIKPTTVFQEYNFQSNSENISYIVKNVEPDIIILSGALDNPASISDYLAGITNIIHDLKNPNIKQLLYLSSLSIFSDNTESIIDENTLPNPKGDWEKAVLMGEKICLEYDHERSFKVKILRFSDIYGTYNHKYVDNNILSKISKQIIAGQEVGIIKNKTHILLYLDDAVDALYKIANTGYDHDEIYNIGPDRRNTYTEEEILIIFKNKVKHNKKIDVIENEKEIINKEYDMNKLCQLGFKEKHNIKSKVQDLHNIIKKTQNKQESIEKERSSVFTRIFKIDGKIKNMILPYMENLLFFIILNVFIYFSQSMSIHQIIDFYLLYVITIGVIYGYEQTIFTVILSVIAKRYITFSWDVRVLALADYFTYLWILQLFTVGVLVGYLKEQYKIKYHDMKGANDYLELQLKEVKDINKKNKEIKDLYEERLLNYKDSFGRIYEIVAELDEIEPKGIIFKSIGVIGKIMDTKDVSIYISSGDDGFFRLVASSSKKSKTLRNSIRISDHTGFFSKLEKKQMYVNTDIDHNYPMMAQGVYKGEKLESIIMIWSLPFENNNLYQMNIFGVACKLIESSLNTAYEYIDTIRQSYHTKYENVLDRISFDKTLEVYQYGKKEGIVEFYMVLAKRDMTMTQEDFLGILHKSVRDTDYIGVDSEDHIRILLTNTNKEESARVITRLTSSGISVEEGEGKNV